MTRWHKILFTIALIAPPLGALLSRQSSHALPWDLMLGSFAMIIVVAAFASWRIALAQATADTGHIA